VAIERTAERLFPYSGVAVTAGERRAGLRGESFDPLVQAERDAARQTSPLVYLAIREAAKQLAKLILSKVKPGTLRDAAITGLQMVVALCDAALAG
jgi:hypothetical protein